MDDDSNRLKYKNDASGLRLAAEILRWRQPRNLLCFGILSIEDIDELAQLSGPLSLHVDDIGDVELTCIASALELDCLTVTGDMVTDSGIGSLSTMSRLEWLNVRRTSVTARGLIQLRRSLSNLRTIVATDVHFELNDLIELGNLGLERLDCSETHVSTTALERLKLKDGIDGIREIYFNDSSGQLRHYSCAPSNTIGIKPNGL